MPVNKTKTMEEIEKESDMHPEFEFDPILDIIKEADEKLKLIKTTPSKKVSSKVKKAKSSKTKGSKTKKGKKTKENDDKETIANAQGASENIQKKSSLKTRTEDALEEEEGDLKITGKDDSKSASSTTKKNKKKKSAKGKKKGTKKTKKPKTKLNNKISHRISLALRLNDNNTDTDDNVLQVLT